MKCKTKNHPHYNNFLPHISINWIHPTKFESKIWIMFKICKPYSIWLRHLTIIKKNFTFVYLLILNLWKHDLFIIYYQKIYGEFTTYFLK